jgi:hypothetical protein
MTEIDVIYDGYENVCFYCGQSAAPDHDGAWIHDRTGDVECTPNGSGATGERGAS